MTRTRKITTDDILDAAERVVVRAGATGLSIDAVAKEAGVSKSRVVYDHKTKSALLEALVDRRVGADIAHMEECVKASSDTPHPELYGRIAAADKTLDDTDRAVAMAISASMSSEENLQQIIRKWVVTDLAAMAAGPKPRRGADGLSGADRLLLYRTLRFPPLERCGTAGAARGYP